MPDKPALGGGFWNSLKSMVVEEVPAAANMGKPVAVVNGPSYTPPPPLTIDFQQPRESSLDPAIRQQLKDAVFSSAPKAWLELLDQVSTLKGVISDEPTAYKAAIAVFTKRGLNYDQLLIDAATCIDVLESKKQEFEKELEDQTSQRVSSRQKAIDDLDTKIQEFQAQLAELANRRSQEASSMTTEKQKISNTKDKFMAAYDAVRRELVDEKNKISLYGKP